MYKVTVPDTIRQIMAFYYRFGIWCNTEKESVYCRWVRRSAFIIFQFTILPSLAVGAIQSDGMDDAVLLTSFVLQCSDLYVKMVYALVKQSEICKFINEIGEFAIQDREEFLLAKEKLKILMNFVRFLIGMCVVAGFLLLSFPIISNQKILPVSISFPLQWDERSDFGYIVAYIYIIVEVVLSIVSSLLTIVIWYLMLSCSIQYRTLGTQFRSGGLIGSMATPTEKKKITETEKRTYFLANLIASVITHRNIYG